MRKPSNADAEVKNGVAREASHPDAQHEPCVVAYFDVETGTSFLDLVYENIGSQPARNVEFKFDPPLAASSVGEQPSFVTQLPFLPPSQKISNFFDSMIGLFGSDLPLHYDVTCEFCDLRDATRYSVRYELNLEVFKGLRYVGRKSLDDQIRELNSISQELRTGNRSLDGLSEATWAHAGCFDAADVPIFDNDGDLLRAISTRLHFLRFLCRDEVPTNARFVGPHIKRLMSSIAANRIVLVKLAAAGHDSPAGHQLVSRLLELSDLCFELECSMFFMDGGRSVDKFREGTRRLSQRADELTRVMRRVNTETGRGAE